MRSLLVMISVAPFVLPLGCEDDATDTPAATDTSTTNAEVDTNEPDPADSSPNADTRGEDTSQHDSSTLGTDDTGSPQPGAPLEVGDAVPDFNLPTHDGGTFTLSQFRGSLLLIGTHPFAGTSVCTQQTEDLEENYDAFADLHTIPFGMGVDGVAKQASWAKTMGIEKLKILSDSNPRGEISGMFGVFDKSMQTSKRGVLIIDQEGVLRFKKVYPMAICPALGPLFEELEKLQ